MVTPQSYGKDLTYPNTTLIIFFLSLYIMRFLDRISIHLKLMSKYGNYCYTTDLTNSERREIGEFCLDYCLHNIGLPKRKSIPKFSIVKGKESGTYGHYLSDEETIRVYYDECKSVGNLISTFIHEYTHHIQNLSKYDSILEKVGYRNHPMEIEANENAREHKQTCLELFRKYKMSSYE